jgi:hypothetical protein
MLILRSEDFYADPLNVGARVAAFVGVPASEMQRMPSYPATAYDTMNPDLRACLREFFAPHNERLYALLGKDFGWEQAP